MTPALSASRPHIYRDMVHAYCGHEGFPVSEPPPISLGLAVCRITSPGFHPPPCAACCRALANLFAAGSIAPATSHGRPQ